MDTPQRLPDATRRAPTGDGRSDSSGLFTPLTRKNITLARRLEEQAELAREPDEYKSLAEVYRSPKFLQGLTTSVICTVAINVLFTWGTLTSWGTHQAIKTYAFFLFQPAGGKGGYTCAALDLTLCTFMVSIFTSLSTFEKTEMVDLGKIGAVNPLLLSKGAWRYVPRGPNNCHRLFLNGLVFPLIFGSIGMLVMLSLWAMGVGGYGLQMDAWAYIMPKSLWLGVEAAVVFTTAYVVSLSNGDTSRAAKTRIIVQEKIVRGTKCLNTTQILASLTVVLFAGYTAFFAYGGVQIATLIGMWTCGGAGILLGIWGQSMASYDFSKALQSHLFYFMFQCAFVVATIVASGFCLVYSEQGDSIVDNNWNKIKTAIILPFTSEYDLKLTLAFNLDMLAGLGFALAFFMLVGVAHFTKRMGPGQDIIVSMQAMNAVLMVLGVVTVWLIGDVGQLTSFAAPDGSFVLVVLTILECGVIFFTGTIGMAVAGKREPKLLVYYMLCLLALMVPLGTFATLCFFRADNAQEWVLKHWDMIKQVLPPAASFWTNCLPEDQTKCVTGFAVTGKANFEAIGWMAVTTACVALLQVYIAWRVRVWQMTVEHFGTPPAKYSNDVITDSLLHTPDPSGSRSRPGSRGASFGGDSSGSRENSMDKRASQAYDYGSLGEYDEEMPGVSSTHSAVSTIWKSYGEFASGVSCAECCGSFAPSNMLMNYRALTISNPLLAKVLVFLALGVTGTAVFIGALFLRASTVCGVIARSPQSTTHVLHLPLPFGCYDSFSGDMTPLGPNGTCVDDGVHFKYPNLFKIVVDHSFPYGYVNVVSRNGTDIDNEVRATLVYSSVKEDLTSRFQNAVHSTAYDFETGTLHLKVTPPDYAMMQFLGGYSDCPTAALTLELPTPVEIDFAGTAILTGLEVCADAKTLQPPYKPLGCTDLEITTSASQVSLTSGIMISLSEIAGNNTGKFITDLVSQYPYRDVTVRSNGGGNVVANSIFAMGAIDFKSEDGYVTVTNSFGEGVTVASTSSPVTVLDLGGVGLNLMDLQNPSFDYAPVSLRSDGGDIFFGNLVACDVMSIGTSTGDIVGATVQILGNMQLTTTSGTLYLNSVNSLASINIVTVTGNVKGSAVVANHFEMHSQSGSVEIIVMLLGVGLKSLAPPNQGPPTVIVATETGDITLEGMQGISNPADARTLHIDLATKAAGNVKVIMNGHGFLGQYAISSLHGVQGVLIEGETMPAGLWSTRGCVPVPPGNAVTSSSVPPQTCPHGGQVKIQTLYGNAEFVVQSGP
jgi:hypothetical protein